MFEKVLENNHASMKSEMRGGSNLASVVLSEPKI